MQINRLYLFVYQCITAISVKVVKAKTTILLGARVHARARNLDFTFVNSEILSPNFSCFYYYFNVCKQRKVP